MEDGLLNFKVKIVYKLAFSGLNSHGYFSDYNVFETLFTTRNKV